MTQLWIPDWPTRWPEQGSRLRAVLLEMHRELRLLQRDMAFWQVAGSGGSRQMLASQMRDRIHTLTQFAEVLVDLSQPLP
ncbi:hypothetical protein GS597_11040 [Synechococcales cyanobacterium C]|uniref:Uncharacterized protein n=1 Tax=Petrachloros mirabilis ULC683 TaxID=2781853 RepID=A0A8K1ZZL0_9CYAN|nr:hypothetical protein [Petrachloros mirabilis]NCJ07032.1 hypothetical protein [Petrachloros mirabilis ULC683]